MNVSETKLYIEGLPAESRTGVSQVLRETCHILQAGWVKRRFAVDVDGKVVGCISPNAARCCLSAAITRAQFKLFGQPRCGRELDTYTRAILLLLIPNLNEYGIGLTGYNDYPARTYEEVVGLVQLGFVLVQDFLDAA